MSGAGQRHVVGGVLSTAIRMQYDPLAAVSAHERGPLDGQCDQLGAHVVINGPAQRAPRVFVTDGA
ncbi:hypothetical protein BHQ20_16405 [Mycobacterium intermedium]|nr:hypothetical protein BHQ20_16405 [Mycobacterium intermedium]